MQQELLKRQYTFAIVPYSDPVAIAAGYTVADTQLQVFSSVTYDRDNFYYCTYSGNVFSTVFKNGLLVCRRKVDGSLVYVRNIQDYNLDRGDTMMGPSRMVCRTKPVLSGNRIYLTSGWVTNIGPQLFCIDKRTGTKIYSIAYDLPKQVRIALGVSYLTKSGDYSAFKGYNAAVSNMDPVVKGERIYLGASSYQNFLNPGLIPTSNLYTGYPFWTDRGCLVVVREQQASALVQARIETAVAEMEVSQTLSLVNAELDPFLPGTNEVLINTITRGPIITPGDVDGTYYFAQRLDSTQSPVTLASVAPFWSLVGASITLRTATGAVTVNRTIASAIVQVNATPGSYLLSLTTTDPALVTGTLGSGQFAIWYVKRLLAGETVLNIYDANGLGYYGYSTWGSEATVDFNAVTFGSGQAHSVPLSERLLFSSPDKNYRLLKRRLVDLSNAYVANHSNTLLAQLNAEKVYFNAQIRNLATVDIRSPRGQRSYTDAIISASTKTGDLYYGVRSVPADVYNFLGIQDPVNIIPLAKQDIDGDLSSSVFRGGEQISAATKNGGLLTIDLTHWNECKWTHSTPQSVGINVEPIVYTGSNSTLGGTVYTSDKRTDRRCDLNLLALSSNISAASTDGSVGTNPLEYEQFITQQGKHIPTNISYAYSYSQDTAHVEWNTALLGTAYGNVTVVGKYLLCNDNAGHLYVLHAKTGKILQTINSGTSSRPMFGGIASPTVDDRTEQVFWIASYDAPGQPTTAGAWGWVLKLDADCF
ncbi:Hypothetical protein POVR2_LOCUS11 [uncultured virus]|nr:Hypothetical protein POVR2_LOCUS11 [uncultured virus]